MYYFKTCSEINCLLNDFLIHLIASLIALILIMCFDFLFEKLKDVKAKKYKKSNN